MTTRPRMRHLRLSRAVLDILANNHRHGHLIHLRMRNRQRMMVRRLMLFVVGEATVVWEQLVAAHRFIKVHLAVEEEIPIAD